MSGRLRTLIVDDEPLAREGLRLLLAAHPDVTIVGEAVDGASAVDAIRRERPDLVLLDVQMPGLSGFDVVERVAGEHLPLVIFATAYDAYAIRAFDVHAFDYLLKPIDAGRLATALERARADLARADGDRVRALDVAEEARAAREGRTLPQPRYAARFAVRDRERYVLVRAADIDWVESAANYVCLNARGHQYLLRMTMTEMERRLDPAQFARIHRSTIVNTTRIAEVRPDPHGDFDVVLVDGRMLRLSRSYRERLLGCR
jgi:two-component system LytT family response regulator